MKVVLIARMKSYTSLPAEEHVWDFGDDLDLAQQTHEMWAEDMDQYLWDFRRWGSGDSVVLIKPGGIDELDLRVTNEFRSQ